MKWVRPISRRSFLERVIGGAAAGGLAIVSGGAAAQTRRLVIDQDGSDPARPSVTDRDGGSHADAPQFGRGGPEARRRGVSDADSGATEDPDGLGRGAVRRFRPEITDADPTDPVRRSDRDRGPNADPPPRPREPADRIINCPGHPRCPRRQ